MLNYKSQCKDYYQLILDKKAMSKIPSAEERELCFARFCKQYIDYLKQEYFSDYGIDSCHVKQNAIAHCLGDAIFPSPYADNSTLQLNRYVVRKGADITFHKESDKLYGFKTRTIYDDSKAKIKVDEKTKNDKQVEVFFKQILEFHTAKMHDNLKDITVVFTTGAFVTDYLSTMSPAVKASVYSFVVFDILNKLFRSAGNNISQENSDGAIQKILDLLPSNADILAPTLYAISSYLVHVKPYVEFPYFTSLGSAGLAIQSTVNIPMMIIVPLVSVVLAYLTGESMLLSQALSITSIPLSSLFVAAANAYKATEEISLLKYLYLSLAAIPTGYVIYLQLLKPIEYIYGLLFKGEQKLEEEDLLKQIDNYFKECKTAKSASIDYDRRLLEKGLYSVGDGSEIEMLPKEDNIKILVRQFSPNTFVLDDDIVSKLLKATAMLKSDLIVKLEIGLSGISGELFDFVNHTSKCMNVTQDGKQIEIDNKVCSEFTFHNTSGIITNLLNDPNNYKRNLDYYKLIDSTSSAATELLGGMLNRLFEVLNGLEKNLIKRVDIEDANGKKVDIEKLIKYKDCFEKDEKSNYGYQFKNEVGCGSVDGFAREFASFVKDDLALGDRTFERKVAYLSEFLESYKSISNKLNELIKRFIEVSQTVGASPFKNIRVEGVDEKIRDSEQFQKLLNKSYCFEKDEKSNYGYQFKNEVGCGSVDGFAREFVSFVKDDLALGDRTFERKVDYLSRQIASLYNLFDRYNKHVLDISELVEREDLVPGVCLSIDAINYDLNDPNKYPFYSCQDLMILHQYAECVMKVNSSCESRDAIKMDVARIYNRLLVTPNDSLKVFVDKAELYLKDLKNYLPIMNDHLNKLVQLLKLADLNPIFELAVEKAVRELHIYDMRVDPRYFQYYSEIEFVDLLKYAKYFFASSGSPYGYSYNSNDLKQSLEKFLIDYITIFINQVVEPNFATTKKFIVQADQVSQKLMDLAPKFNEYLDRFIKFSLKLENSLTLRTAIIELVHTKGFLKISHFDVSEVVKYNPCFTDLSNNLVVYNQANSNCSYSLREFFVTFFDSFKSISDISDNMGSFSLLEAVSYTIKNLIKIADIWMGRFENIIFHAQNFGGNFIYMLSLQLKDKFFDKPLNALNDKSQFIIEFLYKSKNSNYPICLESYKDCEQFEDLMNKFIGNAKLEKFGELSGYFKDHSKMIGMQATYQKMFVEPLKNIFIFLRGLKNSDILDYIQTSDIYFDRMNLNSVVNLKDYSDCFNGEISLIRDYNPKNLAYCNSPSFIQDLIEKLEIYKEKAFPVSDESRFRLILNSVSKVMSSNEKVKLEAKALAEMNPNGQSLKAIASEKTEILKAIYNKLDSQNTSAKSLSTTQESNQALSKVISYFQELVKYFTLAADIHVEGSLYCSVAKFSAEEFIKFIDLKFIPSQYLLKFQLTLAYACETITIRPSITVANMISKMFANDEMLCKLVKFNLEKIPFLDEPYVDYLNEHCELSLHPQGLPINNFLNSTEVA